MYTYILWFDLIDTQRGRRISKLHNAVSVSSDLHLTGYWLC